MNEAQVPTSFTPATQPSNTVAATTGGAQPFFNDAVAGAVVQVKATAGQIFNAHLLNTTAAAAFLQVFFKPAASVTLGTTAPDYVVHLGANESQTINFPSEGLGLAAGTGISIAGTTTATGSTGAAISTSLAYA